MTKSQTYTICRMRSESDNITAMSATHWTAWKTPSFGAHRLCPSDRPNATLKLSRKSLCNSTLSTSSKRRVKRNPGIGLGGLHKPGLQQQWSELLVWASHTLQATTNLCSGAKTAGNLLWWGKGEFVQGNSPAQLLSRDLPFQTCLSAASGEREDRLEEAEGGESKQEAWICDLWYSLFNDPDMHELNSSLHPAWEGKATWNCIPKYGILIWFPLHGYLQWVNRVKFLQPHREYP